IGPECQRKPLGVLRDGSVPLLRSHTIKSHLDRTVPQCRTLVAASRWQPRASNLLWNRNGRGAFDSARAAGSRTGPMNRRDQEPLARQMRRFQPPERRGGVIMLVLVAVFVAGMTVGGIFSFASQHVQQPSGDGRTALAFFLGGVQSTAR